MDLARRVVYGIFIAVVVGTAYRCRPVEQVESPVKSKLAHFEGSLVSRNQTYDPAQSDLYVRAAGALKTGDAAVAEALYREAVARYPKDPSTYTSLATCLFFQARYGDARVEYGRALELDPRCVAALYGLGCVAYKERHYGEARSQLVRALELQADHAPTHRVLAMVYDQFGDRDKARTHYERAVTLDSAIASEEHVQQRLTDLRSRQHSQHEP
jgi:Flp pilus assembly protein TadD